MICLQDDLGSRSMTEPDVLSGYIKWCVKNYPASRYELILWNHGGGSVSGYGYDEKFASSGSMSLSGLDEALKDAGVKFDFIGFDACLMATAETALTMARYADYLIASEETEPGVGWYYTGWLTAFGKNPSLPTVELGRQIVDSFVDTCADQCRGQLTTLSVVDLAELEAVLPGALADFSQSTAKLLRDKEYQTVSNALSGAREFAQSSRIDQVDLVHLAKNLGTKEGDALAQALLAAEGQVVDDVHNDHSEAQGDDRQIIPLQPQGGDAHQQPQQRRRQPGDQDTPNQHQEERRSGLLRIEARPLERQGEQRCRVGSHSHKAAVPQGELPQKAQYQVQGRRHDDEIAALPDGRRELELYRAAPGHADDHGGGEQRQQRREIDEAAQLVRVLFHTFSPTFFPRIPAGRIIRTTIKIR